MGFRHWGLGVRVLSVGVQAVGLNVVFYDTEIHAVMRLATASRVVDLGSRVQGVGFG